METINTRIIELSQFTEIKYNKNTNQTICICVLRGSVLVQVVEKINNKLDSKRIMGDINHRKDFVLRANQNYYLKIKNSNSEKALLLVSTGPADNECQNTRDINTGIMVNSESEGVLRAKSEVCWINYDAMEELEKMAHNSKLRRSRICLHMNDNETMQNMLICLMKDSRIKIAKHKDKDETTTVLRGKANIHIYNEKVEKEEAMSLLETISLDRNKNYYCNVAAGIYHKLEAITGNILYLETTSGPFNKNETIEASIETI